MTPPQHFPSHRVRLVDSFEELVSARFADGVNALCWPRHLEGNFAEIVAVLGEGEGLENLDEERLRDLPLSEAGKAARDFLLNDLRLLRDRNLAPVLNCIHAYPREGGRDGGRGGGGGRY